MTKYYLSNDVYVSVTLNNTILLDLKDGVYLGLDVNQTLALGRVVHGWPSPALDGDAAAVPDESALALARSLESKGLLTLSPNLGKHAQPILVTQAKRELRDEIVGSSPVRAHHAYNLLMSCGIASLALRRRAVGRILKSVQQRKMRRSGQARSNDMQHLKTTVAAFLHLRPWFYSRLDKCLFDSLVMVEFLSRYDLYPTWVIGVKTKPFGAHSWVQLDSFVLNETVESVGDYSPIVAA